MEIHLKDSYEERGFFRYSFQIFYRLHNIFKCSYTFFFWISNEKNTEIRFNIFNFTRHVFTINAYQQEKEMTFHVSAHNLSAFLCMTPPLNTNASLLIVNELKYIRMITICQNQSFRWTSPNEITRQIHRASK